MTAGTPKEEASLPSLEQILGSRDYFSAFGLPVAFVEPVVVKVRYKQLALRVHPDKCDALGAKQAFQMISQAFDVLHSKEAQVRYLRDISIDRARAVATRCKKKQEETDDTKQAWWDTRTWAEFEKRLQNREKMEAELKAKYLSRAQGKLNHRRLKSQVKNAERSCEQLDQAKGLQAHDLWPPELRELHNKAEMMVPPFEGAQTPWEVMLERNELDDPDHCACRLVDLLTHLRTVHVYCLHCGCHFDDADDLERSCPGFDEEAHENAESMAMRRTGDIGVARELAPPPKRPLVPEHILTQKHDEDDCLNDLFAAGREKKALKTLAPKAGQVFGFKLRPR